MGTVPTATDVETDTAADTTVDHSTTTAYRSPAAARNALSARIRRCCDGEGRIGATKGTIIHGSRRTAHAWADEAPAAPSRIDVLIPTAGRTAELAVTLAGLAAQDDPPFRVIVSDQSRSDAVSHPAVQSMARVLRAQGREVRMLRHDERMGMAEHRQFLLDRSSGECVLFLDDDVWLEPGHLDRMMRALDELGCGFVGSAVQGLSYMGDDRPGEREAFEPWIGGVLPERVRRGSPAFDRWRLHNAANLVHAARASDLGDDDWMPYKIAWVGGCVLYRRAALVSAGGFDFWPDLPVDHAGEDVAAQWRVMEQYGGAGILPSGAVHLEAPTTLPVREVDAFDVVFGSADSRQETPSH